MSENVNLEDVLELVLDQIFVPPKFQIISDLNHKNIRMGERDVLTLFSELISNAIKHSDGTSSHIKISSYQEGETCVICFCDDGPGIPEKYRDRVFEAMTTLKPRDEVEGSGMGLATVQKIVRFYDGDISWPKIPNQNGTALELRFPISSLESRTADGPSYLKDNIVQDATRNVLDPK